MKQLSVHVQGLQTCANWCSNIRMYQVKAFLSVDIPYEVLFVSSCTSNVFKLELHTFDKFCTVP